MDKKAMVDGMLVKAREALAVLETFDQEKIDALCKAACLAFKAKAVPLAEQAVEETGMGDLQAKIIKNTGSPDGVWYALKGKKSVGIIGYDEEKHLALVAKPKGILSCVIPSTNPNITVLFNGIYGLKGGNVMLVAPHPKARQSSLATCAILNEAIVEAGGPENVFQCVEEPSIELTQMIMGASDVILATGGAAMVKAAYSSGKPAFGVGPGNVQAVFDEDYSGLAQGIGQTVFGAGFDNGVICACNRSFITPVQISERAVELMKGEKVYYIDDPGLRDRFRDLLFPQGFGPINGEPVGQDVVTVAKMAGLSIPEDTALIVVKVDKYGREEPLCREKMVPLAVHIECEDFEDGVRIAKENLLCEGIGHTSVVHTDSREKCEYAALELPVSRLLVNSPGVFAANPALANGLFPTGTLGCGSWGNNSISENLSYEHLINIARIAWVRPEEEIPSEADIWEGDSQY